MQFIATLKYKSIEDTHELNVLMAKEMQYMQHLRDSGKLKQVHLTKRMHLSFLIFDNTTEDEVKEILAQSPMHDYYTSKISELMSLEI